MIPSLNISYFFVRIFDTLSNVPIDSYTIPNGLVFLIETIATIGMVATVVLLVFIVYVRIRLVQVEHHGFEALEEHDRAARSSEVELTGNLQWEGVLALSSSPNESDWRRAILEADIMLANVLTGRGYMGETVGEQLKHANPLQFTTLPAAWEAHRMRNAIAHLGEAFPLSERDMRATINLYARVFTELGVI